MQGGPDELRTHSQSGLSLVEVSVVLAIIGIIAALALPSMRGTMPKIRLGSSATTLANEISLARVRAISKGSRYRIVFTLAAAPTVDSYSLQREISSVWTPVTTTVVGGTELASVTNFRNPNEVIADTNGTMSVFFNNQGAIMLTTPDGQIRKRILVTPAGRVTLERSSDGGTTWFGE